MPAVYLGTSSRSRSCPEAPAHAGEMVEEGRLTKLWKRSGLGRIDLAAIGAGDIVSVTGLTSASIANTIGSPELSTPLPPGNIEPPTLRCADSSLQPSTGILLSCASRASAPETCTRSRAALGGVPVCGEVAK